MRLKIILAVFFMTPFMLFSLLLNALFFGAERTKEAGMAYSETLNALFFGDRNETLSSRVGRGAMRGERKYLILETIIDFIFGVGHCREAANGLV